MVGRLLSRWKRRREKKRISEELKRLRSDPDYGGQASLLYMEILAYCETPGEIREMRDQLISFKVHGRESRDDSLNRFLDRVVEMIDESGLSSWH